MPLSEKISGSLVTAIAGVGLAYFASASADDEYSKQKSKHKMDKAQIKLIKAESFAEHVDAEIEFINGVIAKANLLMELLITLNNTYLEPLLKRVSRLQRGYSRQSYQDKRLICSFLKVAETIVDVLGVELLTKEGKLTPQIKAFSPEKAVAVICECATPLIKNV